MSGLQVLIESKSKLPGLTGVLCAKLLEKMEFYYYSNKNIQHGVLLVSAFLTPTRAAHLSNSQMSQAENAVRDELEVEISKIHETQQKKGMRLYLFKFKCLKIYSIIFRQSNEPDDIFMLLCNDNDLQNVQPAEFSPKDAVDAELLEYLLQLKKCQQSNLISK